MRDILVSPSVLFADFSKLGREVDDVLKAGADWIHVDVMDGHFVPNITIGAPVVRSLRKYTEAFLDVHLMIENPERYIEDFAESGSSLLTVHIEATKDPKSLLRKIRSLGVKSGITMRPATPVSEVLPFLEDADLVLVMTVNPGFSGQSFMPEPIEKMIEEAVAKIAREVIKEMIPDLATRVIREEIDRILAEPETNP